MRALGRIPDSRRAAAAVLAVALSAAMAAAALAQSNMDRLRLRDQELDAVRGQQRKAAETERILKLEIDSIGDDRRKFNRALIDTAARLRAGEERIAETEARLKPLDETERSIRQSLDGRRAVIAEVL